MPVKAAQSYTNTHALSYLPFYDGEKSSFSFWDAVQISNALVEISGLVYEENLGEGASFIVDLYRVEPASSELPALVAVKSAKISATSDRSAPDRGVDLYSLLLEIQILCHDPIQKHPNIINVLGIDWKRHVGETPIPLLIVEYSKLGNLSSFLQSHDALSTEAKVKLCLDIASGLNMIHSCSVVHGDMKLTNVLLFDDENGSFIAKIADFGCSITGYEQEEKLVYRGTRAYRAPELREDSFLSISDLQKCDVFAFGLCVWEILNNGRSYLEGLKASSRYAESHNSSEDPLLDKFDKYLDETDIGDIGTIMRSDTFLENPRTTRTTTSPTKVIFRDLVHHTIDPIPTNRYSIDKVVMKIDLSNIGASSRIPRTDLAALRFQRASVGIWNFSSPENRTPREAQRQAVVDLQNRYPTMEGQERCRALMLLSHCSAHGYGVAVDFQEAINYLQLAADAGSISAQAVLPRIAAAIWQADQSPHPRSKNHLSALPESVDEALKDIENRLSGARDGQSYRAWIREWSRIGLEYVRRSAFSIIDEDGHTHQIQPGHQYEMAEIIKAKVKNLFAATVISHSELLTFRAPLLQFISSAGWLELLHLLTKDTDLLHLTISVEDSSASNLPNYGNVLLAAAAQGYSTIVRFLLNQGVSASKWHGNLSISSLINALHFLFLFDDDNMEEIAKILFEHGADPNLTGDHSLSISSIAEDFPIELSGTIGCCHLCRRSKICSCPPCSWS